MRSNDQSRPVRVGLISLGCAKNLVDAEVMLGALLEGGMEITNDAETADVLIVNTCSFIDTAQKESVDTVLESAALREQRQPGQALVVSGCLPQRFRTELPKLVPEVDAFIGIDQVEQVPEIVRRALRRRADRLAGALTKPREGNTERRALPGRSRPRSGAGFGMNGDSPPPLIEIHPRPRYIPDFATPRFRLTPAHSAYVKIAEGCNHPCSFCIIPRMRGAHRSRPQSDIVEEARRLVAQGVKEVNLISQDSTYYGLDLRSGPPGSVARPEQFQAATRRLRGETPTLCTLLEELDQIPGDFWVRLLYTHPAHWTDGLIETVAACRKLARYVDIPLQHIHPTMLERMRRETSREFITDLLHRIRSRIPGIALRTTFIVGFPGETEACFESLLDFMREMRFERAGVFAYSQEDGTRAGRMAQQVPAPVRRKRRARAMAVQQEIARGISAGFVGKTLKVLVEGEASGAQLRRAYLPFREHGAGRLNGGEVSGLTGRYWVARGEADAPDIDGRIYVKGPLPVGEFSDVRVIGYTDYDLVAEPVAGGNHDSHAPLSGD